MNSKHVNGSPSPTKWLGNCMWSSRGPIRSSDIALCIFTATLLLQTTPSFLSTNQFVWLHINIDALHSSCSCFCIKPATGYWFQLVDWRGRHKFTKDEYMNTSRRDGGAESNYSSPGAFGICCGEKQKSKSGWVASKDPRRYMRLRCTALTQQPPAIINSCHRHSWPS